MQYLHSRFPSDHKNFRDLGVQLMREAADPASPRAPWLAALPMLRPTAAGAPLALHADTMPREYTHLIGSAATVSDSRFD
jgi:hypothetical protein